MALAGGDYIDEKKAVSRRRNIGCFEGKSTCSNTLAVNESCKIRHWLHKQARARSKAEPTHEQV